MAKKDKNNSERSNSKDENVKELIKTVVVVGIIFGVTFGGFYILQLAMGISSPLVVVTSSSMEPTISEGDMLLVKGVNNYTTDIIKGDHNERNGTVIIYNSQFPGGLNRDEPIVHRVIDKWYNNEEGRWYYKTQGDNVNTNPTPDPGNIPEEYVIGIVVYTIPYVGWPKIIIEKTGATIPILIILIILTVITIIYEFVSDEEEKEEEAREKGEDLKEQLDKGKVDFGI